MKVAIIGAGVSGLALAQSLKLKNIPFKIYERSNRVGGIAHVDKSTPVPFHITGGHCFNSKDKNVLDFVFGNIMPLEAWHKVTRDAKVYLDNRFISYPLEFSLKELAFSRPGFVWKAVRDLLLGRLFFSRSSSLNDYFLRQFGETLTNAYFKPYNEKIWGQKIDELSPAWVKGKLPEPSLIEILGGLFGIKESKMVHAHFYYPNEGKNAFLEALSRGVSVEMNNEISALERHDEGWLIHGEYFEHLIYTGPLNHLSKLLKELPCEIREALEKLKYNKVTSSLWKSEDMPFKWCYLPDPNVPFHRLVFIGKFLKDPIGDFATLEAIGEFNQEELEDKVKSLPFIGKYITHHTSDHAYVVFDHNYEKATKLLKAFCHSSGINLLGRFAEWEYYNMDICIKRALEVSHELSLKIKI